MASVLEEKERGSLESVEKIYNIGHMKTKETGLGRQKPRKPRNADSHWKLEEAEKGSPTELPKGRG
jgi:hypothetical protein